MKIKILGDKYAPAVQAARNVVSALGHSIAESDADLCIAPLLTQKISAEQINAPRLGTLIFHPSPLPYGRGMSAIRWAYRRKEPVTAATWFWANERLDAGDICEQEIVKIDYKLRPRDFYETEIIEAMCRTLKRCLNCLAIGLKRQIPQIESYATYDGRIE
jgi:formyltetrahydrofolate dehydrogenase